ncbi:hypothetical protein GIB67_018323 [Kingdonia uniflora]|uniref:U-box domain-containing protein n=1 Tax=Kingdonia uniflora TaxID=39325 RepID=A0A7J7MJ20_9MAGN|nr:hypothetical protein GIB67_018323 [Kingdonia uniflora]
MVRNDLFITIPNLFKCPISLDLMKSPVSLCTGVTYDRSSIQRWLEDGNNTCPATMQVLQSKDFVPNHTLHRLIKTWSETTTSPAMYRSLSREKVREMIENGVEKWGLECLKKVAEFAEVSDENRSFLVKFDGFVAAMIGVMSNVDSKIGVLGLEQVIRVLELVLDLIDKEELMMKLAKKGEFLGSIVLIMRRGSLNARISSARVLEMMTINPESKLLVAEKEGILFELFRLIGVETDPVAVDVGLSGLVSLSMVRRTRLKIVRFGAVELLGKLLARLNLPVTAVENVLKLLEMIANSTEGRTAICDDRLCVTAIVDKMLKVSKMATERGAVILWSVCYLGRDEKAQDDVIKSKGLTKILLLLQSDCSPSIRQMCSELIKVFRVNSKSCLSGYDTKTTHIMPF